MNEKEQVQYTEHVDEKKQQLDDDYTESDHHNKNNSTILVKSPEEVAFLRKLNWTLLPLIFLIIFIQVNCIACSVVIEKKSHCYCIVLRQVCIDCSCCIGHH